MTVLQYNTVPAEHQPLVAEAPKKKSGRVVAAVAAALVDCVKDVSPQYQLTEWLQI